MKFTEKLKELNACEDAIEWAENYKTFQEVWDNCERADWMLWIAGMMAKKDSEYHKQVVLAACMCARTSLKYLPRDEKRPLIAIQTAERWAKGKATMEELQKARSAAYAYAVSVDADADAAYAAAYAAYVAADAAADAAYTAAYAAYVAADAAADAAVRTTVLKTLANIVRKNLECPTL